MAERGTVRLFAVFAATMAWFGMLLQLYLSLKLSLANGKTVAEGLIIYFGYFTILTNILVALVLTIPLVAPVSAAGRFFARPGVGTATAAAITVVGLAYFFLAATHMESPRLATRCRLGASLRNTDPVPRALVDRGAEAWAALVTYPGVGELANRLLPLYADSR